MSYATPSDYFGKVAPGQPITANEAEIARIASVLEDASDQVDRVTMNARYEIDSTTDLPKDARVLDAFRKATIAWAEYFEEVGDTVGAPTEYDAVRYGSVALTTNAGSAAAGRAPASTLNSPKAMTILRNAGLLSGRVSQDQYRQNRSA